MKTIVLSFLFVLLLHVTNFSQVDLVSKMSKSSTDTSFYRDLGSASRGSWVDMDDIDNNGKPELILTDYSDGGRVHVFEAVNDSTVALVWSSPKQAATISAGSSPRCVRTGDLDGDSLKEIIFPTNDGYYIYEWDGVTGSGNYGTQPSQIINGTTVTELANSTIIRNEYFELIDVDSDGIQELVTIWNNRPTSAQIYLVVIKGSGNWSTNDPGFSGFNLDYQFKRIEDLGAGQPMGAFVGQFNGIGNKDIIIHTWNYFNVFPMRVEGPTNYLLPDIASGHAFYQILLGELKDGTALLGGCVADIDNDGVDEVYLPIYVSSTEDDPFNGDIYMISYDNGDDLSTIDSSKVALISDSPSKSLAGNTGFAAITFGGDWGDIDSDGQKELYFGATTPADVVQLVYNGDNKKDINNWQSSIIYPGESDVFSSITYRDSLGVLDTVKVLSTPFVSKVFAKNMDFNGNGKRDILAPYQGMFDSITVTWKTFSGSDFVIDSTKKIPNPKIWYGRLLEYNGPSVGIKHIELSLITPNDYNLEQNYPNPFNPTTSIRFSLPLQKKISIVVYDILGNEVKTLVNDQEFEKGNYEVTWDGTNNFGSAVASGQYIYTMKYGNFSKSLKMTLLK